MSSSSSQQRNNKESSSMAPAPAVDTAKKNPPRRRRRRMTQEQIDNLIRYETVAMPEEVFRELGRQAREQSTPEELAFQVDDFPVPYGQLDDYIADILAGINRTEARFMRERDRILNDYYTNGYAEEEVEEGEEEEAAASSPPVTVPVANRSPAPGRRRFRPRVTKSKQAGGKPKKMV